MAYDLDPDMPAAIRRWNKMAQVPVTLRTRAEILDIVAGLDLVEPGVVPVNEWHPDLETLGQTIPMYGVVARKR
jgi:hypothetical protein